MKNRAHRIAALRKAVSENRFPILNGRPVARPIRLSVVAGIPASSLFYAYARLGVIHHVMDGRELLVDVLDYIRHLETARPGPKNQGKLNLLITSAGCVIPEKETLTT